MGAEPPFMYDKPSSHNFSSPTDQRYQPRAFTQATYTPRASQPKSNGPLIASRDLNRHPDSYFIVPYGHLNWKPVSLNTKTTVKWVRVLLLVLRLLSFVGAAGLLVCVIFIKPIGSTLDWIIRIPPGVSLLHMTYAIYHLSRSANARTPASSASYMIFGSICDACILPFFVLTALLAHNQLFGLLYNGDTAWQTLLGAGEQTYTIVLSTYIISIVTGSMLLAGLGTSIYLAITFRKISRLPPDMNPLEDNLTSRHKRNKSSISVQSSNPNKVDSASPLMTPSRSVPFMQTRTNAEPDAFHAQRRATASSRNLDPEHDMEGLQVPGPTGSSRSYLAHSSRPPSSVYSEDIRTSKSSSSLSANRLYPLQMHPDYTSVGDDKENFATRPTPTPSPLRLPPELQHLRTHNSKQSHRPSQPPAIQAAKYDKYDYSNRSPRPLGMNPPTPRHPPKQQRSVEDRALQESRGNSASPQLGNFPWEDIQLNGESPKGQKRTHQGKQYGAVQDHSSPVRTTRGQSRVISSGIETGLVSANGVRAREVSGKVAEEGRAYGHYRDF